MAALTSVSIPVPILFFSAPSSVEALASTLVPLAVDHQADDDEEDAAQHGEEHGEENGYATHPFFSRAHWKSGVNSC